MKKNIKITLEQSQMLREADKKGEFDIDGQGKDNLENSSDSATPGIKYTAKAIKASEKVNNDSYKATEKVMGDVDEQATSDIDNAHVEQTYGTQENTEANSGNKTAVNLKYDEEPSDPFKERAKEGLVGSERMGNKPMEDQETTTGADMIKKAVDTKKGEDKASEHQPNRLGGYPYQPDRKGSKGTVGQSKSIAVKENKRTMKRLKFKKAFTSMENAVNLIPEGYKTDGKLFEMNDGNQSYRIRWEGSLTEGKAIVILAKDKKAISEEMSHMMELMDFKAEDTTGILKGNERLDENKEFNNIFDIVKSKTLTESKDKE